MLYHGIDELIGNTPLLCLDRLKEEEGLLAKLYAKLEGMNPAGSAKDRVALQMIRDAENASLLQKGGTIIEPTSGNTGVGLAALGAMLGYRVILTMPENMSIERIRILRAYGAEVILTPVSQGMTGAIAKAKELAREIPSAFLPSQFESPSNPLAHEKTTGPEIWQDCQGRLDAFVSAVGTGGTLTGVSRYLKKKNPALTVIAVEPYDSPVLSKGTAGPHKLQGIGAGFIPAVLEREYIDAVECVTTEEAYAAARLLARREGILAGISSGAALCAAMRLAKSETWRDKTIVVLLPDTGERYLSTELYEA